MGPIDAPHTLATTAKPAESRAHYAHTNASGVRALACTQETNRLRLKNGTEFDAVRPRNLLVFFFIQSMTRIRYAHASCLAPRVAAVMPSRPCLRLLLPARVCVSFPLDAATLHRACRY